MELNIRFKNLNDADKDFARSYLQEKIESLSHLMDAEDEDSIIVNATVEHFEKHNAFKISVTLTIKSGNGGTYTATETFHELTKTIDALKDDLKVQLSGDKQDRSQNTDDLILEDLPLEEDEELL